MNTRSLRLWLLGLLLLFAPGRGFAALSAATVWEVRAATGNDNDGGGFVAGSGGTDYSQQALPHVIIDNSVITTSIAANVITFTGYTPAATDVGNLVHMLTGTNVTAGWYQITTVSGQTWTVTGAASLPTSGTTTNATGNMGGALATLGTLSGAMIASNTAWVTGAFTTTAQITFAQATASPPASGFPYTQVFGYGSTRRDRIHATLQLQTNTVTSVLLASGQGFMLANVDVDCGSLGTSGGIKVTGALSVVNGCKVTNYGSTPAFGVQVTASDDFVEFCEMTGGGTSSKAIQVGASTTKVYGCYIHDLAGISVIGISSSGNQHCDIERCIIANLAHDGGCTGIQAYNGCKIINNTIENVKGYGIDITTDGQVLLGVWNNLLTNCGVAGIHCAGAIPAAWEYDGNAYYGDASNRLNLDSVTGIYGVNPYTNVRDVILTLSPYIGPTTGSTANFALNNTAGGGLACQGAAVSNSWPGNTGTTGYGDMGAVQHKIPKRIEIIH